MLQSLCNSTTNVKKNQNGTQQVMSTCNLYYAEKFLQKKYQNCTQQVTSACTMWQNLRKKYQNGTQQITSTCNCSMQQNFEEKVPEQYKKTI